MRYIIAALAVCFAASAQADMVFTDGPAAIVFHESLPCSVPAAEAAILAFGASSPTHAATLIIPGGRAAACWALDGDGDYIIVTEHGTGGIIYAKALRPVRGAT